LVRAAFQAARLRGQLSRDEVSPNGIFQGATPTDAMALMTAVCDGDAVAYRTRWRTTG
jgi:hypothetical protein